MKEHPILFNGEMVRAILAGKKTQTRRPVKPGKDAQAEWLDDDLINLVQRGVMMNGGWQMEHPRGGPLGLVRCPLGVPGDRLWVRETWAPIWPGDSPPDDPEDYTIEYRADTDGTCPPGGWPEEERDNPACPRWTPSIHMPRWACRLFLDVTDVRVERVEDITEADAQAEGFENREAFLEAWYQIYPAPNPWVWAVSFVWKRFCADHDDRAVEIAREEAEDG